MVPLQWLNICIAKPSILVCVQGNLIGLKMHVIGNYDYEKQLGRILGG
jgi:hypothetical protein